MASGETKGGRLEVLEEITNEQRSRSVTIGGRTLHRTERDPMADVLLRLVKEPRRVLLVGVGTGQLSVELSKQGVEVSVLEQDPVLAQTICSSVGCGGTVGVHPAPWYVIGGHEVAPAFPHLGPSSETSSVAYDAVVIDEEIARYPMGLPLRRDLPGVSLAPGAIIATRERTKTCPSRSEADTEPPLLLAGEREDGTCDTIRISPEVPVAFDGAGLRVWPPQQTLEVMAGQSDATKEVRVFGYLVRTGAGQLAVELPHDRAGAVVVELTGDVAARELGPRASSGVRFTDTVPATKGEAHMLPLVGVGHRLRPGRSVVASDVVVALRGKARFLGRGVSSSDPDRREGARFTLAVSSVERVIDRAAWTPILARHLGRLEAARSKISSSDFGGAASELEASAADLRAWLGADADHCQWVHATENLAQALRELEKKGLLASCAWLTSFSPRRPTTMRPIPHPADVGLYRALKTSTEGTLLRLARRPDRSNETVEAAGCWWRSTFGDPGFPNATHLEISRRFPGVAQPVRD